MITARRLQRNFADGFLAETVEDLWEPRRTVWTGSGTRGGGCRILLSR